MRQYYEATVTVDLRVYCESHTEVEPTLACLQTRVQEFVKNDKTLILESMTTEHSEEPRQEFTDGELDGEALFT